MVTGAPFGYLGRTLEPLRVSAGDLLAAAESLREQGMRLDAIGCVPYGDALSLSYVFGTNDGARTVVDVASSVGGEVPSITPVLLEADWPERRIRSMFGVTPVGHPRPARLVRHAHWPKGYYPLAPGHEIPREWPVANETGMDLVPITGEGIHEIPVGPIHAGIIEPGHFRFYADGERIVGLELRLFYVHRGIQGVARGRTCAEALRLAEVVSGDTAIGHGWAYCSAIESALGIEVSEEALAMRGLLLEMERIANHIGDAGAILNDVAFGWAHVQCQGLREDLLRLYADTFGHRFLRGVLSLGGVRTVPSGLSSSTRSARRIAVSAVDLLRTLAERAPVVGRLQGTGTLSRAEASSRHAVGSAARASGIPVDSRAFCPPYEKWFRPITFEQGDVAARLRLRIEEISASAEMLERFSESAGRARPGELDPNGHGRGIGSAEGWRGECLHLVDVREGRIASWWPRDPSALNWPLLPLAVRGDVVPDFPVINKSFNLSYAGNDL